MACLTLILGLSFVSLTFSTPAGLSGHISRKCAPCQPGWGMVEPCYATIPTLCRPCPKGTYSPRYPHHEPCLPCSKCGRGLYVDQECSRSSDTICDTCATTSGKLTDDFVRKCLFIGGGKHETPEKPETYPQLGPLFRDSVSHVGPSFKDVHIFKGPGPDLGPESDPEPESREEEHPLKGLDIFEGFPLMKGPGPDMSPREDPIYLDFTGLQMERKDPFESYGVEGDEEEQHKFKEWDGEKYVSHPPIPLYPAKHDTYPSEGVAEAIRSQRKRLLILITLASGVLGFTTTVLFFMLYQRCKRPSQKVLNKTAYMRQHLRDQDLLLINDCAARMGKPSPDSKKMKQVPQSGVYAFENPLERLLDDENTQRTV